ncbi:MAG: hypothetical protein RL715_30 [Chloroflexota bacterium]
MIPKSFRNGAVMLMLLLGTVLLLGSVLLSPTPAPSKGYSAFLSDVKSGRVDSVVQQDQTLTITLTGTPPENYQVQVPTQLTDVYGDLLAAALRSSPTSTATFSPQRPQADRAPRASPLVQRRQMIQVNSSASS